MSKKKTFHLQKKLVVMDDPLITFKLTLSQPTWCEVELLSSGHMMNGTCRLNSFHSKITFTAEWSRESVIFLETIDICNGNFSVTDLYTSLTNIDQYLYHYTCSCHPSQSKSSIVYRHALWMWRICSIPTNYQQHMEELKGHLVKRGHDGERVKQSIDKATRISRQELIFPTNNKKGE